MNQTYQRAIVVVSALATAYDLDVEIMPFGEASEDTRRAVSDLAPLISETCYHRYELVERLTLREYATVIEQALTAIDGVQAASDSLYRDTRTAWSEVPGICCGFAIENDLFIVKLTATETGRQRVGKLIDCAPLRANWTMSDEVAANLELERIAFASSRAAWEAMKRQDAVNAELLK